MVTVFDEDLVHGERVSMGGRVVEDRDVSVNYAPLVPLVRPWNDECVGENLLFVHQVGRSGA
jgi:hypothetical protein